MNLLKLNKIYEMKEKQTSKTRKLRKKKSSHENVFQIEIALFSGSIYNYLAEFAYFTHIINSVVLFENLSIG
jgi:hypothetical protein